MAVIYKLQIDVKPLQNRTWLPDINELGSDQLKVLQHPSDRDLIVMGSAGTGKTILSKFLFDALLRQRKNGRMVIFGNIFRSFISKYAYENSEKIVGSFELPKNLANIKVSGSFAQAVDKAATWSESNRNIYDFLIIDEVQDLHEGHLIFCSNISKRLYLFGDTAQQYYDHGKKIEEINSILRKAGRQLRGQDMIEITKNYRNQPSISKAVQPFYFFRPSHFSPAEQVGILEVPEIYIYTKNNYLRFFENIKNKIASIINSQQYYTPTIGILVQSEKTLNFIKRELKSRANLEIVTTAPENAFEDARPIFMTMQSSKGMEFDYVIILDLNYKALKTTHNQNYDNIIFVAKTRARRSFSVFIFANQNEYLGKIDKTAYKIIEEN
ncbi:MAG: ATP-binding domain-containing protein [Ignavibacteria bacterium]